MSAFERVKRAWGEDREYIKVSDYDEWVYYLLVKGGKGYQDGNPEVEYTMDEEGYYNRLGVERSQIETGLPINNNLDHLRYDGDCVRYMWVVLDNCIVLGGE